ncbi:MAG: hypothetical protein WDN75_07400 [Bacteroidota bacterium]
MRLWRGNNGATERRGVDYQHLIVGFDVEGFDKVRVRHIWKKIENVLELIDDLMIHWELTICYLFVKSN